MRHSMRGATVSAVRQEMLVRALSDGRVVGHTWANRLPNGKVLLNSVFVGDDGAPLADTDCYGIEPLPQLTLVVVPQRVQ